QRSPSGNPLVVVSSLERARRPGLGSLGSPRPAAVEPLSDRPAVLVVDDEPDVVETLALYIHNVAPGVEVLTAGSGKEALDALSDKPVALILSDLRMPGMDGIRFLTQARTLKPEARRYLITAYPGPEVEARAKSEAGVESVIRKPMAMAGLRAMLQSIASR
ncbi:MAG: response regulator, partial [Thermoplasmatota archaeon]